MRMTRHFQLPVFAVCLLALVGCAQPSIHYSGFLGDYTGLSPVSGYPDKALYRAPDADFSQYQRIIVERPIIYVDEQASAPLPGDLREKLTDALHEALVTELEGDFQIAQERGPETLALRTALTNVLPTGAERGGGMTVVNREPILLTRSHLEAEVLDSATGDVLFALVDRRYGANAQDVQGQLRWDTVRGFLRQWSASIGSAITQ